MINTVTVDGVLFHVNRGAENWVNQMAQKIAEQPTAEKFRGAHIVVVENSSNNNKLQNCYGVEIAIEILRENPEAKVVLYSFMAVEFIRTKKPEIDIVLKYENARFIQAPFSPETISVIFETGNDIVIKYTVSDEVRKELLVINHGIGHVADKYNPGSYYEQQQIDSAVAKAKEIFSSLSNSSPREVLDFIKSVSADRKEVMKGQEISGVYCDTEGTLLLNEKLNPEVVSILEEYEKQGKVVTIWTDGDILILGAKLKELGIQYPLKSKSDFAGVLAEIVIDDLDEYTFSALTNISARKFKRIKSA